MKISWSVTVSVANFSESGEFEIEDNATDEEIQDAVNDEISNIVEWGWVKEPRP